MLFNKSNVKILQDLDDRGPISNKTTKMEDNVSPKIKSNTPDRNNGDLLKTASKKIKETDFLELKTNKIRPEFEFDKFRLILHMKLTEKHEELRKIKEENSSQFQDLLQTKRSLDNLQTEMKVLKQKLKGMDYWKNLAKNANIQKRESESKIQNLERSLAKEKQIVHALQEYIIKHIYREQNSTRSENYEFLKNHSRMQKLLRNKVNELSEKELQLKEKDVMLKTLKNSKTRAPNKDHLNTSIEIRERIKEKEKEIRTLIAQINMCESAIAGYKNEIKSLEQILAEQKSAMK
ncbi:hypothetical protein HNY73_001751 [Argiope bruennichi]|uniref:Uncharacterized protein n=1 Tax=Argiope bruennichi TaxID=94029 RepID=A0A8T0FTU4_ARGBR|nr:hypothetical protein HNY73_001751 [Argiope bruennichi]